MWFRRLVLGMFDLGFVRALVTRSFLFRPLVRRFVAGETPDSAMQTAEKLAATGFSVSLDRLGEHVATEEGANAERDGYLEIIERIARSPYRNRIHISIKLTALGLDRGDALAESNFRKLLARALEDGIFVCADMESSAYTERTIAMVERVFPEYPNAGTVLQSNLKRTAEDVERLVKLGCRVRMVKGAYLEPPAVAYQDKRVVDAQYVAGSKRLMTAGEDPSLATHDEAIIAALNRFAREQRIEKHRFEWQMLYGIRRDLQERLRDEGYRVCVYVPFGASWYPYFTRRLAERPANVLFLVKALFER